MTNQIFEVSVHYYDHEFNRFQDVCRLYGQETAMRFGLEYGACSNVESVSVVDALTGEIILLIQEQAVTHMVTD